jgi:hypothetical protein
MRKVKGVTLTALFIVAAVIRSYGLGAGTSNADFLKIGVGARPAAMGETYVGIADDSNGIYWNPAGITAVEKWNVTFMHLVWFENTGYDYFSLVFPLNNTLNFGVAANFFWVPPFDSTATNPFGVVLGETAMSYDLAVSVSVAKILGNLYTSDFTIGNISVGGNLYVVSRKILDETLPMSFGLDLGIIGNVTENVKLGLTLQDIGTGTDDDPSPFNARLGVSGNFNFTKELGLLAALDVTKPFDMSNPDYSKWFLNVGGEISIYVLKLRFGYKFGNEDETFTAGGGFKFDFGSIDYAFVPHSELGSTHRISATLDIGPVVPRPKIGAPRPPEKISAVAGDKIVSIGWAPNPESNITGYNIYYKEKSGKEYIKLNKEPIMEETKFRAVLNNDVTYNFVVTAVNNRNLESVYSDVVSATPQKYVPKKPSVVTGVMSKVEGTSIVVMWNENKEDFVDGYNLYYKKTGDARYKRLNRGLLRETKATLAGLKAKTTYLFAVTAVSKDGIESDYSEPVSERIEAEEYY